MALFATWLVIAEGLPAHAQDIVLGQTASVSNPLVRELAEDYTAGLELAIRRANASGGIKGRKLRLAVADDNFDAKQTVLAVDALVEKQNILALVGPMGTQPILRLSQEGSLTRHQLAAIGPFTGLQEALGKPNVFPIRASYEDEVKAMLQHSARLGRTKIAFVFYEAGVGPHLAKLVSQMAVEGNVEITDVAGYPVISDPKEQQAAVARALDKIKSKPQSVILLAIGRAHSEGLKVVRERFGASLPVYSLGQVTPRALVDDVGLDLARGLMLTQVMPMPVGHHAMKIVRDFEADRRAFTPTRKAGYVYLEGYVIGRVTTQILSQAKSLTRPEVLKAAEQAGRMNVGGFIVEYSPANRRSINPVDLTMVGRDGALVR